jgi:hypothetical protein
MADAQTDIRSDRVWSHQISLVLLNILTVWKIIHLMRPHSVRSNIGLSIRHRSLEAEYASASSPELPSSKAQPVAVAKDRRSGYRLHDISFGFFGFAQHTNRMEDHPFDETTLGQIEYRCIFLTDKLLLFCFQLLSSSISQYKKGKRSPLALRLDQSEWASFSFLVLRYRG